MKSSKLTYTLQQGGSGTSYGMFYPEPKSDVSKGMPLNEDGIPTAVPNSPENAGGEISVDFNLINNNSDSNLSTVLIEEFVHANQFEQYIGEENARAFNYDSTKNIGNGNIEFEAKMISGIIMKEARVPRSAGGFRNTGYAQWIGQVYQNKSNSEVKQLYPLRLGNWKQNEINNNGAYQDAKISNTPPTLYLKIK